MPPPSHTSRHHASGHSRSHSQRSQTSHTWPPLPPPPSGQSRVRPRADSLDDAGYSMGAAGQPPAKRSRGDRDGERDRRSMFNDPVSFHPPPPSPTRSKYIILFFSPRPIIPSGSSSFEWLVSLSFPSLTTY
jgi:hypothetical protein